MISCYRWRANLYKELSKPTTSIGLLRADISVNPTISLKHTVTQSNSSALTFDLCPYHSLTWPWTTCLYPLTNVLFLLLMLQLLGLDLVVHLELFCDLLRQHLTQQRIGTTFLYGQLHWLDLKPLCVFRHLAEHITEFPGIPETQRQAWQRHNDQ